MRDDVRTFGHKTEHSVASIYHFWRSFYGSISNVFPALESEESMDDSRN